MHEKEGELHYLLITRIRDPLLRNVTVEAFPPPLAVLF